MISSYQEAREFLESLIKPYQSERIEGISPEYNNPLGRMTYLLKLLGDPHKKFPSVVVSGTSGKTSTTILTASLLSAAGYSVGQTISPHLQKMNERIVVDGKEIADEEFFALVNTIVPFVSQMEQEVIGPPSYFEALLAMAFLYFAQKKVDIVIAEVGLEGKFDGTNTLSPLVFVYTNTSLDHTQILGETVEQIAEEGAFSIKENMTVVSGITQPSVISIFEKYAKNVYTPLLLLGKDFSYSLKKSTKEEDVFDFEDVKGKISSINVSLTGEYQAQNAVLAIEAVRQLGKNGFHVSEEQIRLALKTSFVAGRFEKIREGIILDGAHNPAKMHAFLSSLQTLYPNTKKIFVVGFKKGKDAREMLLEIQKMAEVIVLTEFQSLSDTTKNTSMSQEELLNSLTQKVQTSATVGEALSLAESLAKNTPESMIVITGSLYLVGEARQLLLAGR
ncbi:MAG TPA: folylpolyglutamate synthase/dihydrofolate synthase family protein [Patescibacteria group bacterium]|nr:folylpolyglutamate synthase/dihydrofolate synthase family protein [Patescibacteria group bacterium]